MTDLAIKRQKPHIKFISDEEEHKIYLKAADALKRGDEDEYDRLCMLLPISPGMADDLKKYQGIEALIESGLNLYLAVEAYGEEWLRT